MRISRWCVSVVVLGLLLGCVEEVIEPADPPESPEAASMVAAPLALTPTEYNNTISDLLGFPRDAGQWPPPPAVAEKINPQPPPVRGVFGNEVSRPAVWPWIFPEELTAEGFEGIEEGQQPSAYQVEELHKAALHFGAFALVSPRFFTCADWASFAPDAQERCAWESVRRFAQRAYRRPFVEGEEARLEAFWGDLKATSPLDEAIALTVAGVLESPGFIYRVEVGDETRAVGGRSPLTGWELASKLSYFLWDSAPDEALFVAADRGELDHREGLEVQARRLLSDPRAREALVRFHAQLLGTDKVLGVSPARRAFGPVFGVTANPPLDTTGDEIWPQIMGRLRYALLYESELFIEEVLFEGEGTLTELLTSNQGWMTDLTEGIYGTSVRRLDREQVSKRVSLIAASGTRTATLTLNPVEFPESQRAGVLTLPSVLTLGSYAVQPGPVLRGVRILERLGCVEFGPPPAGVEAALPPDTIETEGTNRARTAAATSEAACAGCHNTINPPGFAFEHYDAVGRYREMDNGEPVDASGVLTLGGERLEFTDGVDFAHQLAANNAVRDCYALRWTRYATGEQLESDAEGLESIQASFRANDKVSELLVSIVISDLFRFREEVVR